MIREKVREDFSGKMAEFMMDYGKMESNMEEESSLVKMEKKEWVNGTMERKLDGYLEL